MEPTPTQLRYIKRNARKAAKDVLAAYTEHSRIPVLVVSNVSVYMSHPLSSLVEPAYTVIPMLT